MVRPGAVVPAETRGNPDEPIIALIHDFQQFPLECLHERELHAKFYSMCRSAFPAICTTLDKVKVAAFHCQYETIWRYRQGDRFSQRYRGVGNTATFDFAVLRIGNIRLLPFLTVVNKTEEGRARLRCSPKEEFLYSSRLIQCAIELKMADVHSVLETTEADVNRLEDRMLSSCCKVAQERVRKAYILGLSRGPLPDLPRAQSMIDNCLQLYQSRYPKGSLCVLVATPEHTVPGGDWPEGLEFPNVANPNDVPVSNDDTSSTGTSPALPPQASTGHRPPSSPLDQKSTSGHSRDASANT